MKHILLIVFYALALSLLSACNGHRPDSEARRQLLEIFDDAETTIRDQGNYPKSLDLYLNFIREADDDPTLERELMTAYISVAVIYGSYNDIENAIAYNIRAYELARKLDDTRISELALTNLAQSYLERHDYCKASQMADSLLSLDATASNTIEFHHSLIRAEVALENESYDDAKLFIMRADSVARNSGLSPYEQSAPLELLAHYYERQGMSDAQLGCLNGVWDLVNKGRDPQPKAESARALMQFHMLHGNIDDARKFQDAYLSLTDSLVNLGQFLSVSAHHQQSQMNSKGDKINTLQREALYHKAIIAVIASLLILAIVFIGVIIYQKRSLNSAYHALFDKSQQLMGITSETPPPSDLDKSAETSQRCCTSIKDDDERNRLLYDRIVKTMDTTRDYLKPDFGLSNLVAMVDSNVAYVSKVVKIYSNMNVPSFINEYRVREACRRIADDPSFSKLTFAAIGESVGFSSQVSFNRAFKKATGMPPSVYHKMATSNRRDNS